MEQKYSHSHDAVAVADRLPLLVMIAVSVGFGLFPMHLYNVVRSGVDPLVARITQVVPIASHDAEDRRPPSIVSRQIPSSRDVASTLPQSQLKAERSTGTP
jgi:NADH-quinone oxidoreductase subunit M